MATITIDKYGWPIYKDQDRRHALLEDYKVDTSVSGTEYTCFDETGANPRIVWRSVTAADGVKTTEFAYVVWENRKDAGVTWAPINGSLTVTQ